MSSAEDANDFNYSYTEEWHVQGDLPPFVRKSRLVASVVQNDVESLKELLDSPKWYNVRDNYSHHGYTLLQIAISQDRYLNFSLENGRLFTLISGLSKEVFDYMLSLEDFPIDAANRMGETPLEVALTGYTITNDMSRTDYYAYELLKRDVKIITVSHKGKTLLNRAFVRQFIRVARLLIEKGADVNAVDYVSIYGSTPLHSCVVYCDNDDLIEGVTMLLYYGADPWILDSNCNAMLDIVLTKSGNLELVQEILFYYTFDEYTRRDIGLSALLHAANKKLPFFYQMIGKISKVRDDTVMFYTVQLVFMVELDYLKVLVENFDYVFKEYFLRGKYQKLFEYIHFNGQFLQNIDLLMKNNKFKALITEIISDTNSTFLIRRLIEDKMPYSTISEIVYYFLSYGMTIKAEDFHLVYKEFGFCELFKILLQMDVKEYKIKNAEIIPALFYNVEIYNIETYLQNPYKFSTQCDVEELLSYSAHPKLKEFCYELDQKCLIEKAKNLPHIPLLMELARDVFRAYFIKTCNITTSKQFYMMLKLLPVSEIHKKIITFEAKLYY